MSLAYADSKESMSLAHANRSAALYRKHLYRECLIDIDAALGHGYPEEKKIKLKDRAEKAVAALRQMFHGKDQNMNDLPPVKKSSSSQNGSSNSTSDFPLVKDIIEDAAKAEKKSSPDALSETLEQLMSMSLKSPPRYLIDDSELVLAHGPSNESPALSAGAKIDYNKKYGRHLVATKPFKPGDIILMEKPYAYVIYRERF